jgi:hypothetical protein
VRRLPWPCQMLTFVTTQKPGSTFCKAVCKVKAPYKGQPPSQTLALHLMAFAIRAMQPVNQHGSLPKWYLGGRDGHGVSCMYTRYKHSQHSPQCRLPPSATPPSTPPTTPATPPSNAPTNTPATPQQHPNTAKNRCCNPLQWS